MFVRVALMFAMLIRKPMFHINIFLLALITISIVKERITLILKPVIRFYRDGSYLNEEASNRQNT